MKITQNVLLFLHTINCLIQSKFLSVAFISSYRPTSRFKGSDRMKCLGFEFSEYENNTWLFDFVIQLFIPHWLSQKFIRQVLLENDMSPPPSLSL